jgi:hypothetical protein
MALIENTNTAGRTTFLSIIGGKIVQKFNTPQDGAVERINKIGNTVWEKHYSAIDGELVNVTKREHPEYGIDIVVEIHDETDIYQLSLGIASAYCRSVLMKLPNLSIGSPYKIVPYSFEDKDKGRMVNGLNIFDSNGGKIPNAYTKEEPNGLPELEKKKVKGKETWDDSERLEFLLGTLPQNEPASNDNLEF